MKRYNTHTHTHTCAFACFVSSRSPSVRRRSSKHKMASAESQPRFGQSVKGLLSDKVGSCSGDVMALTRQVLKGSRSQEVKRPRDAFIAAERRSDRDGANRK